MGMLARWRDAANLAQEVSLNNPLPVQFASPAYGVPTNPTPTIPGAAGGANGVLAQGVVGDAEAALVQIDNYASTVTLIFEITASPAANPANWTAIRGFSVNNNGAIAATGFLAAQGANVVAYDIAGAAQWRLRQTGWTTGTTTGSVSLGSGLGQKEIVIASGAVTTTPTTSTVLIGNVGLRNDGSGGASYVQLLSSAASVNAALVKSSAGRVIRLKGRNTIATTRWLKLFNKATAPVPGTDTPVLSIELLASQPFDIDMGAFGAAFSTGIGYALTANQALADNTAITAGDILGLTVLYA